MAKNNNTPKTTREELNMRQSWSLDKKIEHTKMRIREFSEYNGGKVYVAFSGGLDSTILKHIAQSIYPDIDIIFSDTTNEYKEIITFVKKFPEVKWVHPKMGFVKILKTEGFPVVSKKNSEMIMRVQNPTGNNEASIQLYTTGLKLDGTYSTQFKIPNKFLKLIEFAPITNRCCNILKKNPMKEFTKISGKYPITGTRAEESANRQAVYIQNGCNNYERNISNPLSIWTDKDIQEYVKMFNLDICSLYREEWVKIPKDIYTLLIEANKTRKDINKFKVTEDSDDNYFVLRPAYNRTGCAYCGFGVHLEHTKGLTRLDTLLIQEPSKYVRMLVDIQNNGKCFADIYREIGVNFIDPELIREILKKEGIKCFQDIKG